MPQYLWQAAGFESASASNIIFDTQIPSLEDTADIVEAFKLYHLGTTDFGPGDTIAEDSIHGHIAAYETYLSQIAASAVLTISGTANQITTSGSAGFITMSLPSSITTPGTLTVSNTLTASTAFVANGTVQANVGINIFANSGARDSALTSPIEGTIAYLQDTNQQTIYSGSSWVGIENHGTLGAKIDETQVLALLGL